MRTTTVTTVTGANGDSVKDWWYRDGKSYWRDKRDNSINFINTGLINRIREIRKSHSLYNIPLKEHAFLGKKILWGKKKYIIESIHKQWYCGFYLVALIRDKNNSHGCVYIENISCHDHNILDGVKEFSKKATFLD